jgi:hypothetical protein
MDTEEGEERNGCKRTNAAKRGAGYFKCGGRSSSSLLRGEAKQ